MNSIDKTELYRNHFENQFAACMAFSAGLHNKLKSCNNAIVPSLAINWELTGEPPKILSKRLDSKKPQYFIDRLVSQTCCNINDECVIESVKLSIVRSFKLKHLVYVYKNCKESSKVRVRILCNQIWEKYLVEKN